MVPDASPAPLTGWQDQEATEVRVGGERGLVLLLPWLMSFTGGGDSRLRDATQEGSEEEKRERASSACSDAGRIKVAARNLLVKPRSAENEETWNTLVAKFPYDDQAPVSAAVAEAALASATEG